ncbi:MAG: complex I NDUFA9 subunit family protein [Burkholderiaceae bacterium]
MRHQNILVIGGTGFVGGHLLAALAANGRQVTVPSRRREVGKRLILLPTVDVVQADVSDDATLVRLASGKAAVINLVGILHGDEKAFEAAHVTLPRRIVAACRQAGVSRLLHMSALGASAQGPSMYLRSKAAGEAVVEDAGDDVGSGSPLAVTLFRPSVVFGRDDRFLNLFATMQRWLPVIPLAKADAQFQPVSVLDVAAAFVATLDDPESFSRIYELTGPRVYTLADLVRIAGSYRAGSGGRPRPIVPLPDVLGRLQAAFLEFAPGPTLMSRDNFDSMRTDNIATGGYPGLADLDLVATPLEQEASVYLARKNRRSHLDHLRHDAHP